MSKRIGSASTRPEDDDDAVNDHCYACHDDDRPIGSGGNLQATERLVVRHEPCEGGTDADDYNAHDQQEPADSWGICRHT